MYSGAVPGHVSGGGFGNAQASMMSGGGYGGGYGSYSNENTGSEGVASGGGFYEPGAAASASEGEPDKRCTTLVVRNIPQFLINKPNITMKLTTHFGRFGQILTIQVSTVLSGHFCSILPPLTILLLSPNGSTMYYSFS